jgi:branched-chain amino acid transport system permease protein
MTQTLRHPAHYAVALPVLIALTLLPVASMLLGDTYYLGFASRILIFMIAALSLNLLLGFGGMVSLGHAGFVGLGAYSVAILMYHGVLSALISWPVAVAVAALMALVIGGVALRTRGVYFIMITLAFGQMLYFVFVSLDIYGGDDGLSLAGRSTLAAKVDLSSDTTFYYVVLALSAVVFVALQRLINSRFGRVLQGIQANEDRMEALGYAVFIYKLIAFVLAGAIAGLAGALLANQTGHVSPSTMHWTQSGALMIMVILGGVGSLYGSIVGPLLILSLEEVLSSYTEHWQLPIGLLLLGVVLFAPNGVVRLYRRRLSNA